MCYSEIDKEKEVEMVFRVYGGISGQLRQLWHADCSTGSTPMAIDVGAQEYLFRYLHMNVASDIPSPSEGWSRWTAVQPGHTSSKILGTISAITAKKDYPGWRNGECHQDGGTTDIGGICTSGPHLHQAASNGMNDGCLGGRGLQPGRATLESGQEISTGLVIYQV